MKKLLLGAIGISMALSLAPASAEPGNGCPAYGQGPTGTVTCEYIADGAGAWAAATPNPYTITVKRGTQTIELVKSDSATPPNGGLLATQKGDKVIISMDADCVPMTEPTGCGTVGFVVAGDAE